MEPKVEIHVSEKRERIATNPKTADHPTLNEHPISGDTIFSTLNRPWMDREHTLRNSLKEDFPREIQGHDRDVMERWKSQPMVDDPYHNMYSIIVPTKTGESKTSNIEPSKPAKPTSEAAATSGSK
ncbi:uncharacterized protein F4812DRAFT_71833 [Daldinia caldariorum]|uniref:uncharacterized protein n=1 Tax=Daldinia caldariorum TaxID=326644 RepID=UPI0020083470|nr:uncharacterized protein F4812DRAFT_71833 [Daldinia caldariorum]KAI1466959.1 hypothetical protein F4812DRAFT_71833 [Daldinia caldariorum]